MFYSWFKSNRFAATFHHLGFGSANLSSSLAGHHLELKYL